MTPCAQVWKLIIERWIDVIGLENALATEPDMVLDRPKRKEAFNLANGNVEGFEWFKPKAEQAHVDYIDMFTELKLRKKDLNAPKPKAVTVRGTVY